MAAAAVGLIVQENGIFDGPGTWFSADFASTSWNVIPANSGVVTVRRKPVRFSMPGSA